MQDAVADDAALGRGMPAKVDPGVVADVVHEDSTSVTSKGET